MDAAVKSVVFLVKGGEGGFLRLGRVWTGGLGVVAIHEVDQRLRGDGSVTFVREGSGAIDVMDSTGVWIEIWVLMESWFLPDLLFGVRLPVGCEIRILCSWVGRSPFS